MPDLDDSQHEFAWGVQSKEERIYILGIVGAPVKYSSHYWKELPANVKRKVGAYFRDGIAAGLRY